MCLPQALLSYHLHRRETFLMLRVLHSILGSAHCAVVGLDGLEPSTSRLSGVRSSHLSYRPVFPQAIFQFVHLKVLPLMVEMMGFEPMTPCLQGRCSPS